MRTHIHTSSIPQADRMAAWCETFSRKLFPIDVESDSKETFSASLGSTKLGDVEIFDVQRAAVQCSRGKPQRQRAVPDDVFISLLLHGGADLQQDGRHVAQMPGDIVVWDHAKQTNWSTNSTIHSLLIKVPRQLLQANRLFSGHLMPQVLSRNSPVARLAGRMVEGAAQLGEMPEGSSAAHRLSASLLDVIVAGLEVSLADGKELDKRRCSLLRAKDYMRCRLDNHELNAEAVAGAVGMSSRTLNRLFATEGTTTMRWLWQERLQASYRLIREGRSRPVTEIAVACGFVNLSHFSHAFRRAFGIAPSTVAQRRHP